MQAYGRGWNVQLYNVREQIIDRRNSLDERTETVEVPGEIRQ